MDNKYWSAVTDMLWADLPVDQNFPATRPLLAHYTSVASLEQMLLANEVWFSNPLFMNDWEELRFGMSAGASEFRTHPALISACKTSESHAKLVAHFDQLFNVFDSEHAMDTYVLCLSEHPPDNNDGMLSMWRGYGANGGGVAVVFDASKIPVREEALFIVSKVVYAGQGTRLEWIQEKIVALAKLISDHERSDENLHFAAYAWLERLKLFSLFTKHSGFSEEKEWRMVYLSDRDKHRQLATMLGYAITSKGVEPKLKVRVNELPGAVAQEFSLDGLIERIILGPSISSALAANSVRRMLELNGRASLASKVVASTIPFRP